jgi:predicted phosphoribosyltransferase
MKRFADRRDAGSQLAGRLRELALEQPVVLGLPRGGVVVGAEVAAALDAPLDVVVVRKVGAPGRPELAIGAVAEGGTAVFDRRAMQLLGVGRRELDAMARREQAEVDRRIERYRHGRPMTDIAGRDAVVVDDGLATGMTARAALQAVRALGPASVVLGVPVGAPEAVERMHDEADRVVCLRVPERLLAISTWYIDFGQTSDEEVIARLRPRPPRRDDR